MLTSRLIGVGGYPDHEPVEGERYVPVRPDEHCHCRVFLTGEPHNWLDPHIFIRGLCDPTFVDAGHEPLPDPPTGLAVALLVFVIAVWYAAAIAMGYAPLTGLWSL